MSGFPGGQPGQNGGQSAPDGMELPENYDPSQFGGNGSMPGIPGQSSGQTGDAQNGRSDSESGDSRQAQMQPPGGRPNGSADPAASGASAVSGESWTLIGVSVAVLLAGLLVAIGYKRR